MYVNSSVFDCPILCRVYKSLFIVVDSQRASTNSLEASSPGDRSPSPQNVELNRARTSSCSDMAGLRVRPQKTLLLCVL